MNILEADLDQKISIQQHCQKNQYYGTIQTIYSNMNANPQRVDFGISSENLLKTNYECIEKHTIK